MRLADFVEFLRSEEIKYSLNEPMSRHTTFRIGGESDVLISVADERELSAVLKAANRFNVPHFCLGKGSNLLVSDKGIRGAVISLAQLNKISVEGNRITCGAGASLSALSIAAKQSSLTGLEFAFGIPGTVGGALFMNAGAYGGEMSQVTVSAEYVDCNGDFHTISAQEMELGYRTSVFKKGGFYITSVTVELKRGNIEEISACMEDLTARRKEKQPLEYPSAGSTFKRPVGYFAGALIEKNLLKGAAVGGAQVSEKHAGFIINKGGATCCDVKNLIEHVRQTVLENDGVMLETEVLFVGEQ